MRPRRLIAAGFSLVLIGAVLPFLMVIGVLNSGLLLGALSYFSSVVGLILGVLGIVNFTRTLRV